MVAFDAMTGFRFELLWPAWLMVRAAVESIQSRNQHCLTTISNPSAARFSILFVCVTATSDLICYLFIPIRMLVFLATTFVWINLYYHTQGGFVRTITTVYGGEQTQRVPIVFITCFILVFEVFLRIRIAKYIFLFRSTPVLIGIFPNVTEWTGVSPVLPRSLNAFFGSHCLGYPAILITVSLHYYINEWKLRRKQCDVSNRNEQLFRILVESLPAEYEGPKDYTSQQFQDDDVYYLDPPMTSQQVQPMQAIQAAPTVNATPPPQGKKNGIHKKNGEVQTSSSSSKKKKNGSAFNSTPPPNDKKKTKSIRNDPYSEDGDDSEADDYSWRDQSGSEEQQRKSGGISILRIIFGSFWWMVSALFGTNPSSDNSSSNRLEDDDEEEEVEVEKKNGRTDSLTSHNTTHTTTTTSPTTTKARANTMPTTTRSQINNNNNAQSQKNHKHSNGKSHNNNHQKTNGNAQKAIRDSSHDTNGSNDNSDVRSMSRELESLRAEISSRRILEEDLKLRISMFESSEIRHEQQLQNMQSKIEQMEKKYSTLERHRESDKSQLEQSERKYSDLLGKKAEIEAILSSERKARMESASKKYDVAEHQRERERQLESEIDKLRVELKTKDEFNHRMESELHLLRNYKEENDIEALSMELRLVRDKSLQMEESLAGENKLKQSLFKCLGDARDRIKLLESDNKELRSGKGTLNGGGNSETLMNGRSSTEANNENETTISDQSSPHQNSAMGSPIPFSKMPLTVNVSNRHGSPFSEKLSPIGSVVMSTGGGVTGAPPPDYIMAVGTKPAANATAAAVVAQKQQGAAFAAIRYNEFTSMPTGGEHRLFDTPKSAASVLSSNGAHPEDDFLLNKGKFGAPAQPSATRLA